MTTCPLCNQTDCRDFPICYEFHQKRFQAKQCTQCSFVYLDPRLTPEELKLLYSDEYFLHNGADFGAHSPSDYESAAIKGSVKFPEILGWIQRYKPSGEFFEIGCGMGYFLEFARENGYIVSGIEYAELGARTCQTKFGLNVQRGSFEELPVQPERYDVMFMGDVLEHLIQPLDMLRKAHSMLGLQGCWLQKFRRCSTASPGRFAVASIRMLRTRKKMTMPPYHVNEFTPRTLRSVIERAGFKHYVIVQRIKPPSAITLRGSVLEKIIKKTLHYPNYFLTKSLGIFGDRLLGIGIK